MTRPELKVRCGSLGKLERQFTDPYRAANLRVLYLLDVIPTKRLDLRKLRRWKILIRQWNYLRYFSKGFLCSVWSLTEYLYCVANQQMHTNKHIPTNAYQQMHINKCTPTNAHQQMHTNKCTPTNAYQQMHTNKCTSTNAYQQMHTNKCTSTNAYQQMHTNKCTPTNAHQ
jgi:hypothetical protein